MMCRNKTNSSGLAPGCSISRFAAERSGVVAVEWAMVGPILIFLVLFSFESMAYMLMSSDFDRALREVAFEIRTGQAEGIATRNKWTPQEYVARQVCAKYSFGNCAGKVEIKVETYDMAGKPVAGADASEIYESMAIQLVTAEMPFPLQTMSRLYSDKPWTLQAAQGYMTEPF